MRSIAKQWTILLASCLYIISGGFPVLADDIDIYTGGGSTDSKKTNVLFIIDNSGSMDHPPKCVVKVVDETTGKEIDVVIEPKDPDFKKKCETRKKIDIVKSTLEELLYEANDLKANGNNATKANPALKGINFALMKFNTNTLPVKRKVGDPVDDGGTFVLGFTELQDDVSASQKEVTKIIESVKGLKSDFATPLAETLYEATQFYLGAAPVYGSKNDLDGAISNGFYQPILTGQCGVENHIVLLTDGMPTNDADANSNINNLPDGFKKGNKHNLLECASYNSSCNNDETVCDTQSDCLPLLSQYLFEHDFDGDPDNGIQNVITHPIAFDLEANSGNAVQLLNQTATYCEQYDPSQNPYDAISGGTAGRKCKAYEAKDAMQLQSAFEQILIDITDSATTLTNAAVPISSELYHENEAFLALFKPAMTPHWKGNLKGYQILNTQEPGKIGKDFFDYDSTPKPILDSDGNIKDDVVSRWGQVVDGAEIELSGAESQIPSARQVFTYTGPNSNFRASTTAPLNLNVLNTSIDRTWFGAATDAERDNLVRWALGEELYDHDNNPNTPMEWRDRHVIGDPLHSQPVIIKYVDGNDNEIPFAFFGTNDGFLHAVNLLNGQEAFAFIPKELLPNLQTYLQNSEMTQLDRPYGLDGEITVGKIDGRVMLYFGMRRGGHQYYALDVTNVYQPKFLWQIDGGSGGYEEMGQTWSKPLFAKVNFIDPNGDIVLIVGGGYDVNEDNPANVSGSTKGRAIYIIDAKNGEPLWLAHGGSGNIRTQNELSISEMTHSVPSSIAALDTNYDDVVDRMYFVDIAGQLFRIDLDATEESTGTQDGTTVTMYNPMPNGGRIANLRGTNANEKRRFYNEPEIVLAKFGTYQFARLNVGSGYRANPLDTLIEDRFYSIQDLNIYGPASAYTTVTENQLVDIENTSTPIPADGPGWYFNLGTGEKSLSQSMTLNNHLMFTTYTPAQNTGKSCSPPVGTARFYMVNLFDGSLERERVLDRGGIPPAPMPLIFKREDSNGDPLNPELAIAVGMEFIKDDDDDQNPNPLPPLGLEPVTNKNFWEEL